MKKRTIILTAAAVCLAASILLIIDFTYRRAAEPAFIGDRFSRAESVCAVEEHGYEHMRERMKEFEKYYARIKRSGKPAKERPARPEKMLAASAHAAP